MAWADDMLGMMQGSPDAGKGIQLAVMTGPRSCKAGNMELAEEDLIIASHLLQRSATGVSMTAKNKLASELSLPSSESRVR